MCNTSEDVQYGQGISSVQASRSSSFGEKFAKSLMNPYNVLVVFYIS